MLDEAKQVRGLVFDKSAAGSVLLAGVCYNSKGGCWVGSRLKRFLQTSRSLENLSSGENLAGCADSVGLPSGAAFCKAELHLQRSDLLLRQATAGGPSERLACRVYTRLPSESS